MPCVTAELRYGLRSAVHATVESREEFTRRCAAWMARRLEATQTGSAGVGDWRCWVSTLADPAQGAIAPESGPTLVGAIWVQRIEKLPNPGGLPEYYAYLSSFVVLPALRGCGIGSALLRAALDWCDAEQVDATFLWPTDASRALYQRHGFDTAARMMERVSRR